MKKKYSALLLLIGIFLILSGVFFLMNNSSDQKMEKVDIRELNVDTSLIVGEKIDNNLYSYYSKNDFEMVTLKDSDFKRKNVYEIKVPSGFSESYLNDYGKFLNYDNMNIEIYSDSNFDIDNFINESTAKYNSNGYVAVNYSLNKNVKCGSYNCGYIKFEAIRDDVTVEDAEGYIEKFAFFVEVDKYFYLYNFSLKDMKFSDEFLTTILNSFNIITGKAKYIYTKQEEDLIYGEIKQIKINSKYGYKVSYILPDLIYSEVETTDNNIYSNNFIFNDNSLLNLKVISTELDVGNYIEDVNKKLYQNYNEISHENEETEYIDKKYSVVKSIYMKDTSEEKIYVYNLIYKIENGFLFSITITTDSVFNIDNFMKNFDYKVEKYDNISLSSAAE